jgi:hypothetical protein
MRRLRCAALVPVLLLAGAGAALAGRGDPVRDIRPADQARAKSVLLRRSDFTPLYVSRPIARPPDLYCAALDESDLTVTGEARSPSFTAGTEFVTSFAAVYESRSDAAASWKRGTSSAGMRCLRSAVDRQLQPPLRLVSFGRRAFPGRGNRSFALRTIVDSRGLRVYIDTVAMQVSRMQVGLSYTSSLSPPPEDELRRLTALLAARANRAMRS